MDPYQVLGVSRDATEEDIKRAYKKLSRQYHPDANLDNPKAAEEKFKQIQQAYQQVMREKNGGGPNPYAGGNPYQGQGQYQGQSQGQGQYSDPFEEFFRNFYGGAGGQGQQSQSNTGYEEDSHLRAAGNYVRNGYFQEARTVLDGMEASKRTGRWYYYSAAAHRGLGNNVTAIEHARQAVQMEPGNAEYQMLLNQMEGGGANYQRRQQSYGNPYAGGGNLCMKLCMLNLCCNMCLGGGCCR